MPGTQQPSLGSGIGEPLFTAPVTSHLQLNFVRLEVRLPRTWLSLVEQIAWNYEEETVDSVMGKSIQAATQAIDSSGVLSNQGEALRLVLDDFKGPETSISPDLLSPVPTRDPSPRRLRPKSKSPARWKILKSISDAIQDVVNHRNPGIYGTYRCPVRIGHQTDCRIVLLVPVPYDPRPGRFVRHLDFNHFRTIGMRRSVEEGVNSRFVTGDRVQAVLKVSFPVVFRSNIGWKADLALLGNAKLNCVWRHGVHGWRAQPFCLE